MGKTKSSKNKDDDKKKHGLKQKSKKHPKMESKPLKSLNSIQKDAPAPNNKSLNSLKKIQNQLDKLISQREIENQQIQELQKSTSKLSKQTNALSGQTLALDEETKDLNKKHKTLNKQLKKSKSQYSELALNTDLLRIKASLEKKSSQFDQDTRKLSKEITLLKDLTHRVEHKIHVLETQSLEQEDITPSAKKLKKLSKNNKLLFKKVSFFEEELNQFADTFIQPEQSTDEFSKQLKLLNQVINELSGNVETHDTQIKLLQTDAGNIRKSLQHEVQIHQKNIDQLQTELNTHREHIENNNNEFKDNLQEIKKEAESNLLDHDTQLKLLKTDTGSIRKSLQEETNNFQQVSLSHQRDIESHQQDIDDIKHTVTNLQKNVDEQQFNDIISNIENTQQELIAPLEKHLTELEDSIQSLRKEYTNQQETLSDDTENWSTLSDKVSQFNAQLLQSQDELKQHLEQLHESDKNTNSLQFEQFNETLTQLSEQLSDVTEQSNSLQNLFNTVQEQQNSENEHQDELSKQYLIQQQQLESHDSQLVQLSPLITQTEMNEQQINQISDSLEQLANTQNKLSHLESELESDIQTISQKVDKSHSQNQKNTELLTNHQKNTQKQQEDIKARQLDIESHQQDIESHQQKMVNYQQEQSVSLNKLSDQIKTRSQLFSIGLISVLAISGILFFNQDLLTQGEFTQENNINKQELISQIKTDITNDTFTQINALTKQNSGIINEQFEQVRNSIEQVKKQTELNQQNIQPINQEDNSGANIQALENSWQEQQNRLQEDLSKTQTEQQELNQTVGQLSQTVDTINKQFHQFQESISQKFKSTQPISAENSTKYSKSDFEVTAVNSISQTFYTIQLLGALQKESILSYIKQHQLSSSQIYQTTYQDKPWYILVQGRYSSFSKAKESLQKLPDYLMKNDPWIKKLP
ncbi:MAG: hypothetical protein OQL19_11200 [Gammaproteobacteria bacterium]|nr:hypothetical protein [Gammaproteobacteria bacterium]